MTRPRPCLVALVFGVYNSGVWAIDDFPTLDVDYHELATGYAHLVSFAAEPEIAAAKYTIDSQDSLTGDSTLETSKLPLYKEFSSDTHNRRWYLQGALNYSSLEQTIDFESIRPLEGSGDIRWWGYGGLIEAGIISPLPHGFSWVAGIGGGISRLKNDVRYSNPALEDFLKPIDGSVFNWETNVTTVRANLGLLYEQKHDRYLLKGSAHITHSQIDSYNESSGFGGFSDHAGTLTAKLDVQHPLNLELGERPLYIIGHIGHTNFVGSKRDELGFSSFSELGLSLGIKKWTLGALAIIGDSVSGWNVIFNYDY